MEPHDTDVQDASILIVDDVPQNLQLLGKILSLQNYDVLIATDGEQALRAVEKKMPDVVLLDVMMPELDGFEVCQRIKSDPQTQDIPVIFLTAKIEVQDKIKGFELGASDYINKPFEAPEVLARVQTQIRLKRAQDTIKNHNQQLEAILEQRTKALVRAERQAAISLLLEGIVHNFKNPLTIILGGAQLIRLYKDRIEEVADSDFMENYPAFEKFLEVVWTNTESIEAGSDRLTDMVNSLMVRGRSDRNDKAEPTDLNQLIGQEITFLETNLQFKNRVEGKIRLAETPLIAEVVSLEIAQVFQNLISNAMDALAGQSSATITVESGRQGDTVWFSVSDNGPGIPEEHLTHIFEPFFTTKARVDEEDAESPGGTGLGLHACMEMVNAYHGQIEACNTAGGGAKFTVFLPQVDSETGRL